MIRIQPTFLFWQPTLIRCNPEAQTVRYTFQCNLAALIANPYMMRSVIMEHYDITKDVCWAIEKLVTEHEEPSIIIADLLRIKEQQ